MNVDSECNERDQAEMDADMEEFMNELESDKDMRARINLYRNEKFKSPLESIHEGPHDGRVLEDGEDDAFASNTAADDQRIRLDELLEDLTIDIDEEISAESTIQIISRPADKPADGQLDDEDLALLWATPHPDQYSFI